tara:strand:+ start:40 stop:489 length:450 start_codon:yes stop_codon:yes gene_type:complete
MYNIPKQYVPSSLSEKDKNKQRKAIIKSRKDYKKGKFTDRPKIKGYKSKTSSHIEKAKRIYKVDAIKPSKELSEKCGCSVATLKKIENKGKGAYYSSGSKVNQTPSSWGRARIASAITGGKSARIDRNLLVRGCRKNSMALKLMRQSGY